MQQTGTVMRAFELARAGGCHSVEDIRRHLKSEGYSSYQEHLSGSLIKKQLIAIMRDCYGRSKGLTHVPAE